jgi:hypothetical protein
MLFPFVLTLYICISAILRALNILYDATDHPHRLSSLQFFTFSTLLAPYFLKFQSWRDLPRGTGEGSPQRRFSQVFSFTSSIFHSSVKSMTFAFLRSFLIGGLKPMPVESLNSYFASLSLHLLNFTDVCVAAFLFSAAPCALQVINRSTNCIVISPPLSSCGILASL